MTFNVYDDKNNLLLKDQPSSFTINNLQPLHIYSNFKIINTEGKSIIVKDFSTSANPATEITVDPDSYSLAVGGQIQLNPSVEPFDTTDSIVYNSDNENVAKVSSTGLVTGVASGTAHIAVLAGKANISVTINIS